MTSQLTDEQKRVLTDSSLEELKRLSSTALKFVQDLNSLIEGTNDPNIIIGAIMAGYDPNRLDKPRDAFTKLRDLSLAAFDAMQDEIKKRLSTDKVKCLIPGVHGFTTTLMPDGSVVRERETCNND